MHLSYGAPDILHPHRKLILSRTRSLQVTLPPIFFDEIFDAFKAYLWQMETISLEMETWSASLRDEDLFDDKKWRVRILTLKRCTIRLQPKALPFLEELRFEHPSMHTFPALATWLDLFAGLPQLRVLELVECFQISEDTHRVSDKIQMPNLKRLVLRTSHPSEYICTPLLEALALPSSCALTLGTPVQQSATSYKALLSVLSNRYNAYDNALGTHLDLTVAGNAFTLQTQGSSAPGDTFIYFYFPGGCRHRINDYTCKLTNAGLIFQTVLEAFRKPIASIRWLTLRTYVHEDEQINPLFNLRLLRKFPELQSICLNVESVFGGFPPFDNPSHFTDPMTPRLFWFPGTAYRELVVSRVNFGEACSLHRLCLALMKHLKPQPKRWNSEGCIQTLLLRRCTGLRNWQLAKLEELIGIKYGVDIRCIECEVLDHY